MGTCARCGNQYDRPLTITLDGKHYSFDCFECAIAELAPVCDSCGARIIGHGVQADSVVYCSVHCAERAGVVGLSDRTRSVAIYPR